MPCLTRKGLTLPPPAGFNNNLTLGGPTPIGARKAALTERVKPYLMEVALNEQVQLLLRHI